MQILAANPSARSVVIGRRRFLSTAACSAIATMLPTALLAAAAGDAGLYELFDRLEAARRQGGYSAAAQAEALRALDPSPLSPRARLDHAAVLDAVEREAALRRALDVGTVGGRPSPFTVSAQTGAHRSAVAKFAKVPAAEAADAASALARTLDAETERLRAEIEAGIVQPAPLLADTIEKLRALPAALRAAAPDAAAAIGAQVEPALARQIEVLESASAKAPAEPGVGRLPSGEAWYAAALSQAATRDITPADAHALGQAMAEQLGAEADGLLRGLGLTEGSLGERFRALAARPEHQYPDSAAGRDMAVADMNAHLDRVRPHLPRIFSELPRAEVTVHRLTAEEMAAGRQGWRDNPSFDGAKSGAYYVDLAPIADRPRWALPTMTDHETLPGHLLQAAFQNRADLHPLRARLITGAILEGWSTYAQTLGVEMALYEDPALRLGYLQSVLFRVGRLLADTGIHSQGWTRAQAVQTLADLGGEPRAVVEAEVDRISVLPGFLTANVVGYADVLNLRETARRAGSDLRAYHDLVLADGPLPLAVLARRAAAEL